MQEIFITKDMNFGGIYKIINLKNNKIYIGSSINVWRRIQKHLSQLKNEKHHNKILQNAYNKSSDYFIFILVEKVEDKNRLIEREQYWIDKETPYKRDIGYNIAPTAGSSLGRKATKETLDKMRIIQGGENNPMFGKSHSDETKQIIRMKKTGANNSMYGKKRTEEEIKKATQNRVGKNRRIIQFTIDGEFISEWSSIIEASKKLQIAPSEISKCCKGKKKSYSNFVWHYKEVFIPK